MRREGAVCECSEEGSEPAAAVLQLQAQLQAQDAATDCLTD